MPFLIPALAAAGGWVGGMWTSDGFSWMFYLLLAALAAFIFFQFWG